jgi:hypothetical protein
MNAQMLIVDSKTTKKIKNTTSLIANEIELGFPKYCVLRKIDSEVYFRGKNINLDGLGEILGGERKINELGMGCIHLKKLLCFFYYFGT